MTDDPPDGDADGFDERAADDPSAYAGLTGDFYRGEIDRMTTWRSRLDQTTNWAVVIVAAILTWAFSSGDNPHYVILIGVFGITAFLAMEANRYRQYDVWRDRVRTLQAGLFADLLASGRPGDVDWRADLSEELRDPAFEMSFVESLTHRLRRTYTALLLMLLLAWLARISVFEPDEPWQQTAAIFTVSGPTVVTSVAVFYAIVLIITLRSALGGRVREF